LPPTNPLPLPPLPTSRLRQWDWYITLRALLLLLLVALPLFHAHRLLSSAGAFWRARALSGAVAAWLAFLYAFWSMGRFLPGVDSAGASLSWLALVRAERGGGLHGGVRVESAQGSGGPAAALRCRQARWRCAPARPMPRTPRPPPLTPQKAINRIGVLGTIFISVLSGYASVDFPYRWGAGRDGRDSRAAPAAAGGGAAGTAACAPERQRPLRRVGARACALAISLPRPPPPPFCSPSYLSLFVRPVEEAEVLAMENQYHQVGRLGWHHQGVGGVGSHFLPTGGRHRRLPPA
jgi:hypothetical protein